MYNKQYSIKTPVLNYTTGSLAIALLAVPLVIGLIALWVTLVMVMFAIVSSYYPTIPAFGWWESLGILVLARLLVGSTSSN